MTPLLATLFAFGIGGVSAGIIGFLTVKFPVGGPIVSAGGGIGIAILLLYYPPKQFDPADFAVEIFLKRRDKTYIQSDLKPSLRAKNNFYLAVYTSAKTSYKFEGIPGRYKNDLSGELTLPTDSKWLFQNSRRDTSILLSDVGADIILIRDPSSLTLSGNFKINKPIKIDVVSYPDLNTMTDSTGNFTIHMPTIMRVKR